MIKKIVTVVFIIVILFFADLTQDLIFKFVAENAVRMTTGLNLKVDYFRLGVLSKRFIEIKGLRVFNPEGFSDAVMVDMPEAYADYDLGAIFSHKIHIQDMRLDLREFLITRNEQGVLNLNTFKVSELKSSHIVKIDRLRLKISKIVFKDYSKKPVVVREYNLNLNEQFQNLDGIHSVVRIVIVKAVTGTAIKNLIKFNLDSIQKPVASVLSSGTKILSETTKDTTVVIKGTGGILKETFHAIFGGRKKAQSE